MLNEFFKSIFVSHYARLKKLPGIEYADFGRKLATRQLLDQKKLSSNFIAAYLNPVSSVRYFEFDFIGSILLSTNRQILENAKALDISSPRLFPFWVAEKLDCHVTMINPDSSDIKESKNIKKYIRNLNKLHIYGAADATNLPFEDDTFDFVTSISVIEHINGDGDSLMLDELVRVIRDGGRIFITFPVKHIFEYEYRDTKYYDTQEINPENKKYFFQRFYDKDAIENRLLSRDGILEQTRRYYVETPPNWFNKYEDEWIRSGLKYTVSDPKLMAEHFKDAGNTHPRDRMGICCMTLIVNKQPNQNS